MALPGERWCDVVHRRERYARLLDMLSDGGRRWSIDDAITENLDLPGLLSDYLSQLRDAGECQRAFEVLSSLTVCDPTVGSGAFLFAALDVLEPLYGTLVARAEELEARGQQTPDFYAEASRHPSEQYWALKTICLRSLYGVDIMAEAPEVAKLRLFLKLAAQIDRVEDLEPLPDLDFNIKCGNLLVGVRDGDDAAKRIAPTRPDGQLSLDSVGRIEAITAVAAEMADAYDAFVATQATHDHRGVAAAKRSLLERSGSLRADCDDLLHGLREETAPLDQWVASHQPFHWFIEFPSIWRNGGFDVVIGNPPYIKTKNVTGYRWVGYKTAKCPDLYAVCVERASTLLNSNGRFAMIVMHNICFRAQFSTLRTYLGSFFASMWVSAYAKRPDLLFAGSADVRNAILLAHSRADRATVIQGTVALTKCNRWLSESRDRLFASLEYSLPADTLFVKGDYHQWPLCEPRSTSDWLAQLSDNQKLADSLTEHSSNPLYFKKVAQYFLSAFVDRPPIVDRNGITRVSPHDGAFYFNSALSRDIAMMIIAGRWGYLWWMTYGDEFHVTPNTLAAFPGDVERLVAVAPDSSNPVRDDVQLGSLIELSSRLRAEMPTHLAWQTNARIRVGRYNMMKLRHITDRADWLLARAWDIEDAFEAAGNLRDRMIFGNKE